MCWFFFSRSYWQIGESINRHTKKAIINCVRSPLSNKSGNVSEILCCAGRKGGNKRTAERLYLLEGRVLCLFSFQRACLGFESPIEFTTLFGWHISFSLFAPNVEFHRFPIFIELGTVYLFRSCFGIRSCSCFICGNPYGIILSTYRRNVFTTPTNGYVCVCVFQRARRFLKWLLTLVALRCFIKLLYCSIDFHHSFIQEFLLDWF